MKPATLGQGNQITHLILQKRVSGKQIQELLESGLLADLFEADVQTIQSVDRKRFRMLLGLSSVSSEKEKLVSFLEGKMSKPRTLFGKIEPAMAEQLRSLPLAVLRHYKKSLSSHLYAEWEWGRELVMWPSRRRSRFCCGEPVYIINRITADLCGVCGKYVDTGDAAAG